MKLPRLLSKKGNAFAVFLILYIFLGLVIYLYFSLNFEQISPRPLANKKLTPAESQDFNFIVFGDSGTGSKEQKQLELQMEKEKFELILHTGDLAYQRGSYQEIQENVVDIYKNIFEKAAFYPSLGNHDYLTNNGQPFMDTLDLPGNERYYSVEHKQILFIALDTNKPLDEVPNEMLPWLEDTLQKAKSKWILVYFHHPPFSSGSFHGSEKRVQDKIVPILEKYNVDFVFSGHEHNYQRTCLVEGNSCGSKGVLYIVTGGGGGPLYTVGKDQWFTAKQISAHHFVLAEKKGCTVSFSVVGLNGEQLDQFSKSKCS